MACGCGCCPGHDDSTAAVPTCVDTSKGQTLESIRKADAERKKSRICMSVGCSMGKLYKCCD